MTYRGRLAPSPTGYLHLGHARTFWIAHQRARSSNGQLWLRMEDLDGPRCKPEFTAAALDDLQWFGIDWDGEPILQSRRIPLYISALHKLYALGLIYPCTCSRRDIQNALGAPHEGEEEPIYPGTCRNKTAPLVVSGINWRFRVPAAREIRFHDNNLGEQSYLSGSSFGDFIVWRQDGLPSYQLAVVTDDAQMEVTEVVRGADLLVSTARQLLLYEALGLTPPEFYHCALMRDETGKRLAKRSDSLSLRTLRMNGVSPEAARLKAFSH